LNEHIETVVLDSQGLSAWVAQDRKMLAMLQVFHTMGADLVIGANTVVEVSHARVNMPRLQWALSRVKVEPVTERAARPPACTATGMRSTRRWRRRHSDSLARWRYSPPMSMTRPGCAATAFESSESERDGVSADQPTVSCLVYGPGERRHRRYREGVFPAPGEEPIMTGIPPSDKGVLAAPVDLNGTGHYVHWGVVQLSVANLVVIGLIVVVFVAAVLLPFPRGRGRG
jgi:hypothetical protein